MYTATQIENLSKKEVYSLIAPNLRHIVTKIRSAHTSSECEIQNK